MLLTGTDVDIGDPEASLEGWLQTPLKQNIRRQVHHAISFHTQIINMSIKI